jgi:hypothetical protein
MSPTSWISLKKIRKRLTQNKIQFPAKQTTEYTETFRNQGFLRGLVKNSSSKSSSELLEFNDKIDMLKGKKSRNLITEEKSLETVAKI